MDTLPVELLEQIIARVDVADIWNCRLVNSLWHKFTTERIRRLSFLIKIPIKTVDQLIEFNRIIPPGAFLLTQNFEFYYDTISSRSSTLHVQEFASNYGHSINGLLFELFDVTSDSEENDELPDEASSVASSTNSEIGSRPSQAEAGHVASNSEIGSRPSQAEAGHVASNSEIGSRPSQAEAGHVASNSEIGSRPSQAEAGHVASNSEIGSRPSQAEAGHVASNSEVRCGSCQAEPRDVVSNSDGRSGSCQAELIDVVSNSNGRSCQAESMDVVCNSDGRPCQAEPMDVVSNSVWLYQAKAGEVASNSEARSGSCQAESMDVASNSEARSGSCQAESMDVASNSEARSGSCQAESMDVVSNSDGRPCQAESMDVVSNSDGWPCQAESGAITNLELCQANLSLKDDDDDEDYMKSNICILLSAAVSNLQELRISSANSVSDIDNLPSTFPKLSELFVDCYDQTQGNDPEESSLTLLDQIVSRVPTIRNFKFINGGDEDWNCLKNLPSILENLKKMNENVEVTLQFELRPSDASLFPKLLNSPSPKIVGLDLKVPYPFDMEISTILSRKLRQWIQLHANDLRVLTLNEDDTVEASILEYLLINLPCLNSLEELDIRHISHDEDDDILDDVRFLPKQLPKLRELRMLSGFADLFTGVFPTVTELELGYSADDIDFETKLQLKFPNVKILVIGSIRVAFKFFKLTTLIISIGIIRPDEDYWNILTGGVPRVPDSEICTFEALEEPEMTHLGNNQMKSFSFKDLQHLERLCFKLSSPNLDFVAALIYLSRVKILRRLRELLLHYPEDHPIPIEFQEELRRHHDKFEIISVFHDQEEIIPNPDPTDNGEDNLN